MRQGRVRRTSAVLLCALLAAPAVQASTLEPYQMVRSLQLVQDNLAAGDHAALPMQRKLLEMIDERLRKASGEEFQDERNLRAVLVYGVSGGNPRTVDIVLSRLDVAEDPAASGILAYLQGNTEQALSSLAQIDPMAQEFELGAILALVKGSVVAGQEPEAGLRFLDQARLLAPGTLIEESALRRSIALAATLGETDRFLLTSSQYIRRFLRSPYASQFADAFVGGVVDLHASIDMAELAATVSEMPSEHQQMIYLRLARKSAIGGLTDLSTFAAQKAGESGAQDDQIDPRARLYSSIASVTSATVEQVAEKLQSIDPARLTESDRKLLAAAEAIAAEVLSTPDPARAVALPGPAVEIPASVATPAEAGPPIEVIMNETRKRLEEIDKLLEASGG